ncbi:hypothetical protein THAOC_34245 [Thalassiosira oceanica]|uniref:Uncharacterized protein n=1 Tax=Thalassiosira oceanica TaxID=159749 RepID=K0R2U8_THAOC|nr:hypothetical protein THAOC_34245 [Thalassiosira oceanica]|eukprot:EJK47063.1 hypothetical protein THAOC_34245 [Thalassiosira oceanica]
MVTDGQVLPRGMDESPGLNSVVTKGAYMPTCFHPGPIALARNWWISPRRNWSTAAAHKSLVELNTTRPTKRPTARSRPAENKCATGMPMTVPDGVAPVLSGTVIGVPQLRQPREFWNRADRCGTSEAPAQMDGQGWRGEQPGKLRAEREAKAIMPGKLRAEREAKAIMKLAGRDKSQWCNLHVIG